MKRFSFAAFVMMFLAVGLMAELAFGQLLPWRRCCRPVYVCPQAVVPGAMSTPTLMSAPSAMSTPSLLSTTDMPVAASAAGGASPQSETLITRRCLEPQYSNCVANNPDEQEECARQYCFFSTPGMIYSFTPTNYSTLIGRCRQPQYNNCVAQNPNNQQMCWDQYCQ